MAERVVKVGIHIWVPGKIGFPDGMPEVENNRTFVNARTRRLAEGPDNQVLFIVRNYYHDTRDHFGLGKEWDGHLIQTDLGTPKPVGMNFRQARDHILSEFPAEEYEFWGTELYVDGAKEQNPTWGCVKGAFDNLRLPGSKIDVSSCWVNALPGGIDPNANLFQLGLKTIARKFNPRRLLKAASSDR